jgi:meso-butanediol dehydrogenase/(S,S)-butanediol dehydrogenase/diacetyl reductase|tara:strand:+ start:2819 stop:3595 length:777 start_codon:yes stop_codon:yes gene_type:complete
MSNNQGIVVVVTGAGSGIGKATVARLADDGAKVVAVDLTEGSLEWTDDLDAVISLAGDVTDPALNERMVSLAVESFGRLDGAALNAGILVQGDITRGSMSDFDRVMDVNVRGVALGLKSTVEALAPAGGSIAITGSVSGLRGDSGLWAYNASKGAVVNLARAAALDLGHLNIRVNAVCPGPIHTGLTEDTDGTEIADAMEARLPLGRFGEPEEVAAAISFLLSSDSSFITGAAIPVDGGITAGTGQWATYEGRKRGYL